MGPEASLALREGDGVLVRGKVELLSTHSGLIRIPCDLQGGHRKIEVPYSDFFNADSSTAAYEATRLALVRIDQLKDIVLKAQAEIYELGQHAGQPPIV